MRSSSLHHNPLIVWRIENAAGEGPYYETAASKGAGPKRSRPVIDFGVRVEDEKAWWASHRGWRFGFAHKEDAVDWFGEAGLRKLAEKGYRLVPKEAAIVEPSQSGMQVFYLPVEKKLSGKEQMRDLQKQIETAAAAEGWDRQAQFSLAIWTIASLCRDARENWPFDKGLLARYLRELKQYQQPGESVREAWDRYAKQVKFRKRRRNPLYDFDLDYDPSADYDVVEPPKWASVVNNVLANTKDLLELLDLRSPVIYYADFKDGHLAKYVDGTSSKPVIVFSVQLEKQAKKQRVGLLDAIEGTLYHELGHAFVDSSGMREELSEEDEEEMVEEFARTCGRGDPEFAVKMLRNALG